MEPAGRLDPQPWMTAPATVAVMAALGDAGAVARFVGGCVRDAVLGRTVKDIDIATDAEPGGVLAALRDAGVRAVPTGLDHGTVTAVREGRPFEITTLRHDVETFGRRARVAFTDDWAADAARRDLTLNALYCDADGTLYDPVGGLADLKAGRVRFVGAARARIEEDVLRLLRFFRFHAHYGQGAPDEAALAACAEMAPRLEVLSAERVWMELKRLLAAPDPASVLDIMAQRGALEHVLPEASRRDRLRALCDLEAALGRDPDPVLRLAASAALDGRAADAVALRLRFSNADRGRLIRLAAPEAEVAPAMDERARRVALYRLGAATFADLVLIGWAEEAALGGGDIERGNAAAWRALLAASGRWKDLSLPVGGADAMALGVPRGPEIGNLLGRLETWWIGEDFRPGRKACLDRLRALVGKA
ncbi:MAG: CCA tRNA nucleotidyltransferase [Alphaproteobacteria bacterium]|nr:CCA tRNA nucleotidyltransferase [Alphaproteobacteria bacterium]